KPRIWIKDPDLNTLYNTLTTAVGQDLATFIIAYRQYGPAASTTTIGGRKTTTQSGSGAMPAASTTANAGPGQRLTRTTLNLRPTAGGGGGTQTQGQPTTISSLYDLVNSQVAIPNANRLVSTNYPSPLRDSGQLAQLLPLLLDKVSTTQNTDLTPRININTAPAPVLYALPGLQESDVQAILAHRPSLSSNEPPDPIFQTPAWLIAVASLSPTTVKNVEKYITTRSQVFSFQVLGYYESGGPTARLEPV